MNLMTEKVEAIREGSPRVKMESTGLVILRADCTVSVNLHVMHPSFEPLYHLQQNTVIHSSVLDNFTVTTEPKTKGQGQNIKRPKG